MGVIRFRVCRQLFLAVTIVLLPLSACSEAGTATEFCLDGEFDLGARYQGMHAKAGETYLTSFCYVVEDGNDNVLFSARGPSNPDMQGDWTVAFRLAWVAFISAALCGI